jgi:hypothetical protein
VADEVPGSLARYVEFVPESDLLPALEEQIDSTLALLRGVPEERGGFRYAPGKWSLREVIGHLADSERVFYYRALRFARADETPLPGFDEDLFVEHAAHDRRALGELVREWELVRRSGVLLFRHLEPEAWVRRGTANGSPISVRGLGFAVVGHARVHLATVRDRYLKG